MAESWWFRTNCPLSRYLADFEGSWQETRSRYVCYFRKLTLAKVPPVKTMPTYVKVRNLPFLLGRIMFLGTLPPPPLSYPINHKIYIFDWKSSYLSFGRGFRGTSTAISTFPPISICPPQMTDCVMMRWCHNGASYRNRLKILYLEIDYYISVFVLKITLKHETLEFLNFFQKGKK